MTTLLSHVRAAGFGRQTSCTGLPYQFSETLGVKHEYGTWLSDMKLLLHSENFFWHMKILVDSLSCHWWHFTQDNFDMYISRTQQTYLTGFSLISIKCAVILVQTCQRPTVHQQTYDPMIKITNQKINANISCESQTWFGINM